MLTSFFPLLSAILFLTFAIAVYLSDTRTPMKRMFTWLCIATFWWQFSWFILFSTDDPLLGGWLADIGHIGILFLPVWLYHLTLNFTQTKTTTSRVILYAGYVGTLMLELLLLFTPLIINGVTQYSWGMYPKAGVLHPVFIGFVMVMMLCSLHNLYHFYRHTTSMVKKQQVRFFLLAILCYNLAAVDFITNYGVSLYPFGFVFIAFFLVFMWQGITTHYLLKISKQFRSIISFTVIFSYVWIVSILFPHFGSYDDSLHAVLMRLCTIALFVAVAIIVYEFINKVMIRILEDYQNPKRLMIKIHEEIEQCSDQDETVSATSQILSFLFPTDHAFVFSDGTRCRVQGGKDSYKDHPLNYQVLCEIASHDNLFPHETTTTNILKYSALPRGEQEHMLEKFKKHGIGLISPIYYRQHFIGNLVLGEKPYQEEFSKDEVDFVKRIISMFATKYFLTTSRLDSLIPQDQQASNSQDDSTVEPA